MPRWPLLILLLLAWASPGARAQGRFELQSSRYPVIVYTEDPVAAEKAVSVLDRCAARFERTLGVAVPSSMHYVFRMLPKKAGEEAGWTYPVSVVLNNRQADFVIYVRGNPGAEPGTEVLIRTFFLVLLQSMPVSETPPKAGDTLPDPPFWLWEGLTQSEMPARHEAFYKIGVRLAKQGPMPSIDTVQGWTGLSSHRLEQFWQQAFCYRLLRMATATAADQAGLRAWLHDYMNGQPKPYWENSGEVGTWWRQGRGVTAPAADPVYDWDQTVARLDAALVFRIRLKDERESATVMATGLPSTPDSLADPSPITDNMVLLSDLQLRAHFVWQPIVQEYREALASWLQGDTAAYKKKLTQAIADRNSLEEYMGQVRGYLDWYQVNYPVQGDNWRLLEDAGVFSGYDILHAEEKADSGTKVGSRR